jgi:hypothetical protein
VLLFKKVKGLNPTRRELVMTASMSLRWFSPTDADAMVTMAVESGYLKANGTGVSLTFDPSTVQIPPGFTPSAELIKIKRASGDELLPNLVKAISERTKAEQRKVMARVNSMVLEMNVDVEVAALILALESGVDAKQFIDKIRLDVLKRYGVRA